MATVDLGKISFTQKGTWNSGTAYVAKDIVQYEDDRETSSYVAVASSTNQAPATNGTVNTTYWVLFAKGASVASNNQGTYNGATAYQKGDIVQYTDSGTLSSYLAVADSTGQTPSTGGTINGSYWSYLAKGTAAVAVSWDTSIKTSAFTAQSNSGYFCDTSGGSFLVTTPASPSVGDEFIIVDYQGNFGTNGLNIDGNGTDKISGTTDTYLMSTNNSSARFVYSGATEGWITVSASTSNDTGVLAIPYNVEYLVVAAGGGGGGDNGGGAGAGGYRTNGTKNFQVIKGTSYTVTVGSGGIGGTNDAVNAPTPNTGNPLGANGGNSVFSTITSAGGGGGGTSGTAGAAGGSGGGGGQNASGGAGNTPSVSPSQGNNGGSSTGANGGGGGGGGAGAVGTTTSGANGTGGAGTASSISGSSVTYAGGGGGGEDQNASSNAGSGGAGGGGSGGNGTASIGGNGTANTGGGGGGGGQLGAAKGGTGGSGIVIIRRVTADSATASGGSETTDGTDTIHTFTSSGTYVA